MNIDYPDWVKSGNIYEVNLRQYTKEGTFDAFAEHLPRLRDMGVKILWFMPITPIGKEERLGALGSYYSVADYKGVNPEYGTLDDFKKLVKHAQQLGLKVIIDFVANHTSNDHPWLIEHPDFYVKDEFGEALHPHGWHDVSQLDYTNPKVSDFMIDALEYWVRECDIDGYRCDMAHLVPLDFWIRAVAHLRPIKSELFWLAECEVPAYHQAFHATYTWKWMHASYDYYHRKMDLRTLLSTLFRTIISFPSNALLTYFTSNHDENSWNGTEYEKYGESAELMAVFSFTWPGIGMMYSGQELPNLKRLKFFEKDEIDWSQPIKLESFYHHLLHLKRQNIALHYPEENALLTIISSEDDREIFAYHRQNLNDEVLVVLNCCPNEKDFEIKEVCGEFRNVFGGPNVHFSFEQPPRLHLPKWGYLVLEKIAG